MTKESRGLKRAGSADSGEGGSKAKKQKASVAVSEAKDTSALPNKDNEAHHEIPFHGEKWHHHHRYNTRLQEEIEGPEQEAQQLPNDSPNPNGKRDGGSTAKTVATPTRIISPPQNSQKKIAEDDTSAETSHSRHVTPTNTGFRAATSTLDYSQDTPQSEASKSKFPLKTAFSAAVFFGAGLSMASYLQPPDDFLHRRHQDALKAKLNIVREVEKEFHQGPCGLKPRDHALFHPPLDSLLGESTKRQVSWLKKVHNARDKVSHLESECSPPPGFNLPYIEYSVKAMLEDAKDYVEQAVKGQKGE